MPPFPVAVHFFPTPTRSNGHPLPAYEHLLPSSSLALPTNRIKNIVIFIHGLGDGPFDVPYVRALAERLAGEDWSLFEICLSSAYSAFGSGSLEGDVEDLKGLVGLLREEEGGNEAENDKRGKGKIVLMGHSTGCQDVMEWCKRVGGTEEDVDGFILQGPVSDREAIVLATGGEEEKLRLVRESLKVAGEMVRSGRGEEVLKRGELPEEWRGSPVTAYRWWSLAAFEGDDDYFSSDLPDEKVQEIWGRVRKPMLIMPSGEDQYVPAEVDVKGMVQRWKGFCREGVVSELSGLIPGADHSVRDEKAQGWMIERVVKFLGELGR